MGICFGVLPAFGFGLFDLLTDVQFLRTLSAEEEATVEGQVASTVVRITWIWLPTRSLLEFMSLLMACNPDAEVGRRKAWSEMESDELVRTCMLPSRAKSAALFLVTGFLEDIPQFVVMVRLDKVRWDLPASFLSLCGFAASMTVMIGEVGSVVLERASRKGGRRQEPWGEAAMSVAERGSAITAAGLAM